MPNARSRFTLLTLLLGAFGTALGQGMPTSQPALITIYREEVRVGRVADHATIEAGWPAAYEKAKSPYYYLAFVSLTGPNEAWFIAPFDSHKAVGESMKMEDEPTLAAELRRLSKADAEVLNGSRIIQAAARTDLSRGAFPDLAKVRFSEVTWFRVRPGHEQEFEAAAKAYGAAAGRAAPNASYRVYEVIAGMPGPTYLVFSSVTSYGEFDQMMADGMATMKGFTPEEMTTLQKFSTDGLINAESQRFRIDPGMSYVSREIRAQDPAFWMPKAGPRATQP